MSDAGFAAESRAVKGGFGGIRADSDDVLDELELREGALHAAQSDKSGGAGGAGVPPMMPPMMMGGAGSGGSASTAGAGAGAGTTAVGVSGANLQTTSGVGAAGQLVTDAPAGAALSTFGGPRAAPEVGYVPDAPAGSAGTGGVVSAGSMGSRSTVPAAVEVSDGEAPTQFVQSREAENIPGRLNEAAKLVTLPEVVLSKPESEPVDGFEVDPHQLRITAQLWFQSSEDLARLGQVREPESVGLLPDSYRVFGLLAETQQWLTGAITEFEAMGENLIAVAERYNANEDDISRKAKG